MKEIQIIKKDGSIENFDKAKIINAVNRSAERVSRLLTDEELNLICEEVKANIIGSAIEVGKLHNIVEDSLENVDEKVAKAYRDYRNYKRDFVSMLDEVYKKARKIMYLGDKENSNTDSTLVSTKRSLIYNELNKEFYNKFFLNVEEKLACKEGYIYIHDKSARLDTMNCCLFDTKAVMTGGFEMGNMWYNEPKTIDTACDVLGDIIMMSASMQYGGWSTRVDDLLAPYVKKSHEMYKKEIKELLSVILKPKQLEKNKKIFGRKLNIDNVIDEWALRKAVKDLEQGAQGLEYKLNSVASSRGDYPFTTFALGLGTDKYELLVSEAFLKVRKEGQGKEGKKRQVLFPKLIFLYDENIHGEGKECEDIFNKAIECSSKSMYPDFLSLTGEGYVPSMYKEYGEVIYPMGCRAFLSPWYRKGGMYKADENDTPVFTGRFNIGAVTLNLIMIYQLAKETNKDFYKVLDYYLEMIRNVHIKTYAYLSEMKASTNPLAYCEGGFYGGNLKPNDKIESVLKYATASFGITGLNELQRLHNGKSLVEDNEFALEVMNYINNKVDEFKKKDGNLYAVYGTPAESLCGLQIKQFRDRFGIIENVSSRTYTSNSFHCHVSEDISPIEKQDRENEFWNLFNGGKIQYVKYPIDYNTKAMKSLVRRAMKLGLYEGVNLELSYCDSCGHSEVSMVKCPKCGSEDVTKIDRMNGYLSYSRVKGDTRLNDSKMDEIKDRISM